jgi:hypothetical protein
MMGQVTTAKGSGQSRGTHPLEIAGGETNQDRKRKQLSEWHSRPGGHRGKDNLGR